MSWRTKRVPLVDPDWRKPLVPRCSTGCASYKPVGFCSKLGTVVSGICTPAVEFMAELLDAAEGSGQHPTLPK